MCGIQIQLFNATIAVTAMTNVMTARITLAPRLAAEIHGRLASVVEEGTLRDSKSRIAVPPATFSACIMSDMVNSDDR
jgi:hypothetical protein